jgi:hypothetical protein
VVTNKGTKIVEKVPKSKGGKGRNKSEKVRTKAKFVKTTYIVPK